MRFVVLVLNIIPAVRIDQSLGTFILDIRQPFFGLPARITSPVMLHFLIKTPDFLSNCSGLKNLELLYGIHNKVNKKYLKGIMLNVGLDSEKRKAVKKYSIGMKQRLGIAQAIMENQEIIILDEPMNGLDIDGIQQVKKPLVELKEQGRTILLVSHNYEDIEELCDVIYEMSMGKIQQKNKILFWRNNYCKSIITCFSNRKNIFI